MKGMKIGWVSVVAAALVMFSAGGAAAKSAVSGSAKEVSMYRDAKIAEKVMAAEWALFPETASIGDVVMVRSGKPGDVAWQGITYALQSFGTGYYAYLPVPRKTKPGKYRIGSALLTVQDKKFPTQYLKVSKKMQSMKRNTKRITEDQKKIDAARKHSQPNFLFSSNFILPVKGRVSTQYGETRYVNGKFDKSHMAIDYAAKAGTPVKAANDGIVVLADSLYLTGNSIYIDHGMDLFSQYVHLSKIYVKTGQKIKRGQVIGAVGSTGFSTGPHLHFAFWAHNVQVNPERFVGMTPFMWAK